MSDNRQVVKETAQQTQSEGEEKDTIGAYVPQEIIEAVDAFCEQYDVNRSEAIAFLLDQALQGYDPWRRKVNEVHDLLEHPDLTGVVAVGHTQNGELTSRIATKQTTFEEKPFLADLTAEYDDYHPTRSGDEVLAALVMFAETYQITVDFIGLDPIEVFEQFRLKGIDEIDDADDMSREQRFWNELALFVENANHIHEVN